MTKKDKVRDKYYQKKYGITLRDYNQKLKSQNGACALCLKPGHMFTKRLAVDHNHKTGKVRGLVCFYCNRRRIGQNNLESASRLYGYMLRFD